MNERIRLLAEQAEFSKRDLLIQGDNFQRFAELVAKEQIEICRDMFIVGSVSWNLLNEKLEHFGVEE